MGKTKYHEKIRILRTNFKPYGDLTFRRNELRKIVILKFITEKPGKGTGYKTSRYRYIVEKLKDCRHIYLTRPAPLKWGFDFIIHVEGETFRNGKDNPAHEDILEDLKAKKEENFEKYKKLHRALLRVYECEEPDDVLKDYPNLEFKSGLSVEAILKVVKWFFIEQDIRYWNYSGRVKFKIEVIDDVIKS